MEKDSTEKRSANDGDGPANNKRYKREFDALINRDDESPSSLACRALSVVLQYWMIPENIGWKLDSLLNHQTQLKDEIIDHVINTYLAKQKAESPRRILTDADLRDNYKEEIKELTTTWTTKLENDFSDFSYRDVAMTANLLRTTDVTTYFPAPWTVSINEIIIL